MDNHNIQFNGEIMKLKTKMLLLSSGYKMKVQQLDINVDILLGLGT